MYDFSTSIGKGARHRELVNPANCRPIGVPAKKVRSDAVRSPGQLRQGWALSNDCDRNEAPQNSDSQENIHGIYISRPDVPSRSNSLVRAFAVLLFSQ